MATPGRPGRRYSVRLWIAMDSGSDKPSKILLVDDDRSLLDVLRYNLEKENYDVFTATDGGQALEMARAEKPDLIVLDVMLPVLSGLEVCRILRQEMNVPILMLSARVEEVDRVVGLELGADDYITKPFGVSELMARIRATLRRSQRLQPVRNEGETKEEEDVSGNLKAGVFEVDVPRHSASLNGQALQLSPKEFQLLTFLIRNRGRVFHREQLVEKLWGYDYDGTSRTVDVHVRSLRRKIEDDPANPRHLVTVHGLGYKFES
jgi:two-component system OmpR family response regulator